eukprot:SAG11_NODE_20647_length_441_cov_0.757310_1_plen_114_part_01
MHGCVSVRVHLAALAIAVSAKSLPRPERRALVARLDALVEELETEGEIPIQVRIISVIQRLASTHADVIHLLPCVVGQERRHLASAHIPVQSPDICRQHFDPLMQLDLNRRGTH